MRTIVHKHVMEAITLFLLMEQVYAKKMSHGSLKCQHVKKLRTVRELFTSILQISHIVPLGSR